MQEQFHKINQYATENEKTINKQKTKVKRDFTPKLVIDNEPIEVVEEIKLLEIKIATDLRWK